MAGYAHPLAFKAITDAEILKAEQFVREKTLSILQKNYHDSINEENCDVLIDDDQLRDYFGDLYAQDTTSFRFEAGDILLIKELVDHVKQIADGNGKNTGLRHFTNEKIPAPKKRRVATTKTAVLIDHNQIKMDLEEKVSDCFRSHVVSTEENSLNIGQVKVEVNTKGDKVYGLISCIFCEAENKKKPKRVYYNCRGEGSGSWVMSNFISHLQNMHSLSAQANEIECSDARKIETDEIEDLICNDDELDANENSSEIGDDSSVILVDAGVKQNDIVRDDPDVLFIQLSSQITNIMAAVLSNRDKKENINFCLGKSPRQLTVAKIQKDGSCMFGALSHQLWNFKITSKQHIEATKKLRADVVEYILNPDNFSLFEFHLKDRVYETKKSTDITNITTECKLFARHVLANNKTWGGIETLLAVSELHSTNIVIFNEDGICTKYKRSDRHHDRSIAIVHRFGLNAENELVRDHFDSVSDIGSADLLESVRYISK